MHSADMPGLVGLKEERIDDVMSSTYTEAREITHPVLRVAFHPSDDTI